MTLEFTHRAMGCEFRLLLCGQRQQALYDTAVEVWELVDALDGQLSHYNKRSEISYINATAWREPVLVEPALFQLLHYARDMWVLTDGALDVTMGPLALAWGFFSGDVAEPPPGAIDQARALCGMEHVTLDPDQRLIALDRQGVRIDLGALGKGYTIDRAVELLRERGVQAGFLSAGGSSAFGYGLAGGWPVRVADPYHPDREPSVVHLDDQAVSTSGPAEQSVTAGGVRRSHLIEPKTGEPSGSDVTATVIAPTALEAEALSTPVALRVTADLQPNWLLSYLARAPDVRVMIVEPGDEATRTVELSLGQQGVVVRNEKTSKL
jgi:thiamine biosynthesis lipoprotein